MSLKVNPVSEASGKKSKLCTVGKFWSSMFWTHPNRYATLKRQNILKPKKMKEKEIAHVDFLYFHRNSLKLLQCKKNEAQHWCWRMWEGGKQGSCSVQHLLWELFQSADDRMAGWRCNNKRKDFAVLVCCGDEQLPSHPVTQSPSHLVTQSSSRPHTLCAQSPTCTVTQHTVTQSPTYPVTQSLSHISRSTSPHSQSHILAVAVVTHSHAHTQTFSHPASHPGT
jgi:hypothetical protein